MQATATDLRVRSALLDATLTAYTRPKAHVCCHCGGVFRSSAPVTVDGPVCDECAGHPRFDHAVCPDCETPWADTWKPCEGCGLTVETVAQRYADGLYR